MKSDPSLPPLKPIKQKRRNHNKSLFNLTLENKAALMQTMQSRNQLDEAILAKLAIKRSPFSSDVSYIDVENNSLKSTKKLKLK